MARILHSPAADTRLPLARSNLRLLGAIALAISVLAFIAWGFLGARPTKLPQSAAPVTLVGASGPIRTYGSIPELFEGNTGAKASLRELSLGPLTLAIG